MNWLRLFFLLNLLLALPASGYELPDARLQSLLDAGKAYKWQTAASGNWLLQSEQAALPALAQLQQPKRGLAGMTLYPQSLTNDMVTGYQRIIVQRLLAEKPEFVLAASEGQRLLAPVFSPDERWLSFVVAENSGLFLEFIALESGVRKRLPQRLNAVFGVQYQWLADSSAILAVLAPPDAKMPVTAEKAIPRISQSDANSGAQRTLQLMLQTAEDELDFEHFIQSRLVHVDMQLRVTELLQSPIQQFSLSPDNQFVLVQQIRRPYSQRVRYQNFTQQFSVLALAGTNPLFKSNPRDLFTLPLHEQRSRRPGPRLVAWRPDQAATLFWAETSAEPKQKDRLWQLPAPFVQAQEELYTSRWRIERVLWSATDLAVVYESLGEQQRAWLFPQGFTAKANLWFQRHNKDLQAYPGDVLLDQTLQQPLMQVTANGKLLVRQRQLATAADSLVELDPQSLVSRIVWQSRTAVMEQLVRLLPDNSQLITRQSPQQPAELFLVQDNTAKALVKRAYLTPAYQQMRVQVVNYQRADGVALSGRLLLPAGYTPDMGALPVLMWAYPREFPSAELAEQRQIATQQFVSMRLTSAQPYVALGYAVFDQVSMPIIAAADKAANDDFISQLTANAEAAVKALIEMGVAEADNIAIGGHSYGAFMVANLLAHTQLFQAGIARSGAYNRTLTPFGFQAEKRSLWQEPMLYQQMSPFLHADKITAPLLLIHGEADTNSGTFPMQSTRLFDALQGLGKPARLVILPYEGHHYQARESVMHLLWEQEQWLKRYLRVTPAMQQLIDRVNDMVSANAAG